VSGILCCAQYANTPSHKPKKGHGIIRQKSLVMSMPLAELSCSLGSALEKAVTVVRLTALLLGCSHQPNPTCLGLLGTPSRCCSRCTALCVANTSEVPGMQLSMGWVMTAVPKPVGCHQAGPLRPAQCAPTWLVHDSMSANQVAPSLTANRPASQVGSCATTLPPVRFGKRCPRPPNTRLLVGRTGTLPNITEE